MTQGVCRAGLTRYSNCERDAECLSRYCHFPVDLGPSECLGPNASPSVPDQGSSCTFGNLSCSSGLVCRPVEFDRGSARCEPPGGLNEPCGGTSDCQGGLVCGTDNGYQKCLRPQS
jgi:hypothetical protein